MGRSVTKKNLILCIAWSLFFLLGCGQKESEKISDTIVSANSYLSEGNCQSAINLLESIGHQATNARYVKSLASAYACRAGYSTVKFFADDVTLSTSPSILGGVSRYSTSLSVTANSLENENSFKDLQRALNILLYAGGIPETVEPTSQRRSLIFGAQQTGDIDAMISYMGMVQLGKLIKVYGNTNVQGEKGQGTGGNQCFTDYAGTPIDTYIQSQVGRTCHDLNEGHPDLKINAPKRAEKLCEGIVLFNQILDVIPRVILEVGGGDLGSLESTINDILDERENMMAGFPEFAHVAFILNQKTCEAIAPLTGDPDNTNLLATYYGLVYEEIIE